jgi:hypothetical protein
MKNICFWRKVKPEPKKEPMVFEFSGDEAINILRMLDRLEDNDKEKHENRYRLWTYINKIYPPTAIGRWLLDTDKATKIRVIEKL